MWPSIDRRLHISLGLFFLGRSSRERVTLPVGAFICRAVFLPRRAAFAKCYVCFPQFFSSIFLSLQKKNFSMYNIESNGHLFHQPAQWKLHSTTTTTPPLKYLTLCLFSIWICMLTHLSIHFVYVFLPSFMYPSNFMCVFCVAKRLN